MKGWRVERFISFILKNEFVLYRFFERSEHKELFNYSTIQPFN